MTDARIFQGKDTKQVDGLSGKPAVPLAWYWEPKDYEGDTLWSRPYATQEQAVLSARGAPEPE